VKRGVLNQPVFGGGDELSGMLKKN